MCISFGFNDMKRGTFMRKRIFSIIKVDDGTNRLSTAYDIVMMIVIVISIVPLAFKEQLELFLWIDRIAVSVFIIDYLLRLFTADYMQQKRGFSSFLLHFITPMALVDLLSILPSVSLLNSGFRLLKLFRLFRTFRALKLLRYSKNRKSLCFVWELWQLHTY